jgi:hypothetical protein
MPQGDKELGLQPPTEAKVAFITEYEEGVPSCRYVEYTWRDGARGQKHLRTEPQPVVND